MQIKFLNLLSALLFLSIAPAWAQDFAWQAQVAPVAQAGYYRIKLSPQVVGRLQPNLADIRLYQPDGKEVPYLLKAEKDQYSRISVQSFSRTDSAATQTTYLHLRFGQPVYPEQVIFHIAAPSLYHRQGKIILGQKKVRERRRRKRRRRRRTEEISVPVVLHSNAPALVELPRQKVEDLVIEIENGDNLPLVLDSVQVLQLDRYLVASLSSNQFYTLRFGVEDMAPPKYDLAFFQDSIPLNAPVIQVQHIKALSKPKSASSPRSSTLLIWAAISFVALGLVYMTWRLLKDMEEKKK